MIKLADLQQPLEVYEAVMNVLKSGRYVKGSYVEEFEKKWATRCGKRYAIAVSNGAVALELALDAVFAQKSMLSTQSFVYKAVGNAIRRTGRGFYINNTNPDIFTHHHHDQPLPTDYFPKFEDCSHCHGYKPKASTAIFSFFPTKILGACGEAGAIVTDSWDIYQECRAQRSHQEPMGTNARMDEMQAAVLLAKLSYLDGWNSRRREIVRQYDQALGTHTRGDFHYVYCIEGSVEKKEKLEAAGVESAFYYTPSEMALPLHPFLTNEEVRKVIDAVKAL